MKLNIIKAIIISILLIFGLSSFAASASCTARNALTNQFYSASGKGETQAAATQDAQNNVLQNCTQVGGSPDQCVPGSCASSDY